MKKSLLLAPLTVLIMLLGGVGGIIPAFGQTASPVGETLPASKLVLKSAIRVDMTRDFATLPLHKGTFDGKTVWYVLTDVSDARIAQQLGLNFAPKLAHISDDCPGCAQQVLSTNLILGQSSVTFEGAPDFSPMRMLEPGPTAFPPLSVNPGGKGSPHYSPFVRVKGSEVVYNAPIVATGDGPFDVTLHTDTQDRVLAIDTTKMTVDLLFVRGFSNGKNILYLSFEASDPLTAVIERSTFVPGLALSPFANGSLRPDSARAEIFTFTNAATGKQSPPAQGLTHVIVDGLNAKESSLENPDVLEALRVGGDAHNVLEVSPTLNDPKLALAYSPLWDLNIGVWNPAAVAQKLNTAQTDANQIRVLAGQGMITSPGGLPLGSANIVINCPVLAFVDDAPVVEPVSDPRLPDGTNPKTVPSQTFKETGFTLSADYLKFWQANGGLPVFGYPISAEHLSDGKSVQWLERNRLELHPENQAPYNVLLGRLGVEALAQKGIDWTTLPKVNAAPNGCLYFAATGHSLCGSFLQYWQGHGLSFSGASGGNYSQSESLALFGYAITEPKMETNSSGATVMTQWFERARFEFYPDNASLYKVQLGRLGAELIPG